MISLRTLLVPIFAVTSVLACSSSDSERDPSTAGPTACTIGQTRCEGDEISTCERGSTGTAAFGTKKGCANDGICKAGACVEPSESQRIQAAELADMLTYVQDNTAWPTPLDWQKLETDGKLEIFRGDGSELAYFGALFHAFIAVPQGHQGLYLAKGCGVTVPMGGASQRGACGQPHSRGIVVTNARAGNPLGLEKGDLVTAIGSVKGKDVLSLLADRPTCAISRPGTSFRDASTASTFADLVHEGETLEVTKPDGSKKMVTVPAGGFTNRLSGSLECSDPFGRDRRIPVESIVRPDGIGVIRLPGFTDPTQSFPTEGTQASVDTYREKFEAKIQVAFDAVKSARAIIWDVRGNPGGLTLIGLDIASGFPGARSDAISYCTARIPKSDPPTFDTMKYAEYALTPGGRFAFAGKVAILTDGNNYSAADYFPLAVKTRTNAILVGSQSAGGFGATSESKVFEGPPAFSVSVDLNRCVSAENNEPLEGKGVVPHVVVEYDGKDLAAGIDTVMERAVAELGK